LPAAACVFTTLQSIGALLALNVPQPESPVVAESIPDVTDAKSRSI
jgi:hypothetical protein